VTATQQLALVPSFDLGGRVALVTGAGRGIGRAIALALAHHGADVALGLRDGAGAADIADQIRDLGRRSVRVPMDVRDLRQVRTAVDTVVGELGRIDVLVNNAGLGPANPAEDVVEDDFGLTFDVNVKGTFFASQAAARHMIAQGSGTIVSLSSQAGFVALPTEAVYCMSKAAVVHMTRCLAVEWGRYGITVNAVAPTFIRTEGTAADLADPVFESDVRERIAGLHRIGEPMEVAGTVVFLASPAASLITGTTLLVDGGWTAR
jgi:NAD(P)-dependent dehydrogenase (short-subunit alcohol dehydrogenase family)